MLNPHLFPMGSEYFLLHSHLTFFPNLIAASVRLTHLSLAWTLFCWHLLSLFLFLLACWTLMRRCFPDKYARWCGLTMITALLTLSVAGTALYIMDQYINPRNLTAFAVIFAVVAVLDRRYVRALLFLVFATLIHPFMTAFAISFCLLLGWMDRSAGAIAGPGRAAAIAPGLELFQPPSPAYTSVAAYHRYQFLGRWRWFELLGAIAPLAILSGFSLLARDRKLRNLDLLCRSLVIYGAFYFLLAMAVSLPARLALLARLQPMRSLYLLYVLFFLFAGGFLGQFVLRDKLWRWLVLFLPLCSVMYLAERSLFPGSAHIEWPGQQPRNAWARAFLWIRDNTPTDAVFALNPYYMQLPAEDEIGFRAVAQRSQLADGIKDGGVVEMFPQIGDSWLAQVNAQTGIDNFQERDLEHLESKYGVTWVVLGKPSRLALACPYQNEAVLVCRLR